MVAKLVCLIACLLTLGMSESHTPGNVVTSRTFTNPIFSTGPDPWVEYHAGMYYAMHTTANSLKIYRTPAMSKLRDAESKVVWTAPSKGMNSREVWAPEIHHIDGKWYIYYAADDGDNANHRMWVLENQSADPFEGIWVDKGMLRLPDNRWAIDGSIFEFHGQLYFMWSGWEGPTNVRQDIYITKMSDPWTPIGNRVRLSKPELAWETKGTSKELPTVNEGPQFITHGDKAFIVYSASGCWTDEYALGLLTTDTSADLMNPSSWVKSPEPLFRKNAKSKAFGPGHNAFFKSPDGKEDWIIYHANPEPGQGCGKHRSTRMQRFGWNTDGTPEFGEPVPLGEAIAVPSGE